MAYVFRLPASTSFPVFNWFRYGDPDEEEKIAAIIVDMAERRAAAAHRIQARRAAAMQADQVASDMSAMQVDAMHVNVPAGPIVTRPPNAAARPSFIPGTKLPASPPNVYPGPPVLSRFGAAPSWPPAQAHPNTAGWPDVPVLSNVAQPPRHFQSHHPSTGAAQVEAVQERLLLQAQINNHSWVEYMQAQEYERRLRADRLLQNERRLNEERRLENEWLVQREHRLEMERRLEGERRIANERRIASERRLKDERLLAAEQRMEKMNELFPLTVSGGHAEPGLRRVTTNATWNHLTAPLDDPDAPWNRPTAPRDVIDAPWNRKGSAMSAYMNFVDDASAHRGKRGQLSPRQGTQQFNRGPDFDTEHWPEASHRDAILAEYKQEVESEARRNSERRQRVQTGYRRDASAQSVPWTIDATSRLAIETEYSQGVDHMRGGRTGLTEGRQMQIKSEQPSGTQVAHVLDSTPHIKKEKLEDGHSRQEDRRPRVAIKSEQHGGKRKRSNPGDDEHADHGAMPQAGQDEKHRKKANRAAGVKRPRKVVPCRFFQKGMCTKGDACTFIHDRGGH